MCLKQKGSNSKSRVTLENPTNNSTTSVEVEQALSVAESLITKLCSCLSDKSIDPLHLLRACYSKKGKINA